MVQPVVSYGPAGLLLYTAVSLVAAAIGASVTAVGAGFGAGAERRESEGGYVATPIIRSYS